LNGTCTSKALAMQLMQLNSLEAIFLALIGFHQKQH
jgi:hypothetical protein